MKLKLYIIPKQFTEQILFLVYRKVSNLIISPKPFYSYSFVFFTYIWVFPNVVQGRGRVDGRGRRRCVLERDALSPDSVVVRGLRTAALCLRHDIEARAPLRGLWRASLAGTEAVVRGLVHNEVVQTQVGGRGVVGARGACDRCLPWMTAHWSVLLQVY